MSILFDGANSKLQDDTASGFDVQTKTIVAWLYANGQGENSFGEIIGFDETNNAYRFTHTNAANKLQFFQTWTTTNGRWDFPASDSQWNAVAVSYDWGSASNVPVARVNFASATVTPVTSPAGTPVIHPNTGYVIGNRAAQDRTWDGRIQHLQFFNVILTADEMDAALRRPGSIRRGLLRWWPLLHSTYINDYVGGSLPTATALTTADSAPVYGALG